MRMKEVRIATIGQNKQTSFSLVLLDLMSRVSCHLHGTPRISAVAEMELHEARCAEVLACVLMVLASASTGGRVVTHEHQR